MAQPYVGDVRVFAGNFAPRGWHLCGGTLLSISDYSALYSLLGTTFGGNGTTNFALPDLRGRAAIGEGQGPGLTDRTLGEASGTENVTLRSTVNPPNRCPTPSSVRISGSPVMPAPRTSRAGAPRTS